MLQVLIQMCAQCCKQVAVPKTLRLSWGWRKPDCKKSVQFFLQANCPAWLCREQIVSPMANGRYPQQSISWGKKNVDPLCPSMFPMKILKCSIDIEISVLSRLVVLPCWISVYSNPPAFPLSSKCFEWHLPWLLASSSTQSWKVSVPCYWSKNSARDLGWWICGIDMYVYIYINIYTYIYIRRDNYQWTMESSKNYSYYIELILPFFERMRDFGRTEFCPTFHFCTKAWWGMRRGAEPGVWPSILLLFFPWLLRDQQSWGFPQSWGYIPRVGGIFVRENPNLKLFFVNGKSQSKVFGWSLGVPPWKASYDIWRRSAVNVYGFHGSSHKQRRPMTAHDVLFQELPYQVPTAAGFRNCSSKGAGNPPVIDVCFPLASGKHTKCAMENGPVEIVVWPIKKTVIFSTVKRKRLPEGKTSI